MNTSPSISTFLWFDHQAEEAAKFYTSIFKNSKILKTSYYGKAGHDIHGQKAGTVLTVDFELNGRRFQALNGGPLFKFNESISLVVNCETQEEIDYYWEKLSADPKAEQCGWLKDQFGLSWQIVPTIIEDLMNGSATEKSERMMAALLKMKKLDIAALQEAYEGK
jgi:predicted 3-demethylubiquinone-9 3-methyltransferase (glyoxalase superfamily)